MPVCVWDSPAVSLRTSTVSRMLAELGAVVIDADLLAREVVGRGPTDSRRSWPPSARRCRLRPVTWTVRRWAPGCSPTRRGDEIWRPSSTPGSVPAPPRSRPRRPRILIVHDIPLLAETGQGRPSTPWWSWTCRASSRWSAWCASGAGRRQRRTPGSPPRHPARSAARSRRTSSRTRGRSRICDVGWPRCSPGSGAFPPPTTGLHWSAIAQCWVTEAVRGVSGPNAGRTLRRSRARLQCRGGGVDGRPCRGVGAGSAGRPEWDG